MHECRKSAMTEECLEVGEGLKSRILPEGCRLTASMNQTINRLLSALPSGLSCQHVPSSCVCTRILMALGLVRCPVSSHTSTRALTLAFH